MKRLKQIIVFSCIFICFNSHARKALVIVPVADLIGNPIATFDLAPTAKESYAAFSISGGAGNSSLQCPRIHQLLFNETVDIVSEQGDEVAIQITSAFFITHTNYKPQTLYWTLKKNLISYEKLERKKLPLSYIPPTPDFNNKNAQEYVHIIGLLQPFYDANTQQTFSAGTQFVYDPQKSTASHFFVYIFDKTTTTFTTNLIPRTDALIVEAKNTADAIAQFIHILKGWAHPAQGAIPYVWGGSSFSYACNAKVTQNKTIYHRTDCPFLPYAGYDCTGIILRAAQLAGIPYFYKNSYTLAHHLKTVTTLNTLKAGDIIWIPGHVMIISSLHPALLIEARGYPHGYGIVHEIPLEKVFKGIKTYAQLIQSFHKQKPLIRLDKNGKEMEKIKHFKLLSLSSLWE